MKQTGTGPWEGGLRWGVSAAGPGACAQGPSEEGHGQRQSWGKGPWVWVWLSKHMSSAQGSRLVWRPGDCQAR